VGTAANHDARGRRTRREAGKLAIGDAQQNVAGSEGAEWIQHQLRTRLPMVELRILDYYRLMQHVGEASLKCFGEGTEAAGATITILLTPPPSHL
jgi:hypothetical protein